MNVRMWNIGCDKKSQCRISTHISDILNYHRLLSRLYVCVWECATLFAASLLWDMAILYGLQPLYGEKTSEKSRMRPAKSNVLRLCVSGLKKQHFIPIDRRQKALFLMFYFSLIINVEAIQKYIISSTYFVYWAMYGVFDASDSVCVCSSFHQEYENVACSVCACVCFIPVEQFT